MRYFRKPTLCSIYIVFIALVSKSTMGDLFRQASSPSMLQENTSDPSLEAKFDVAYREHKSLEVTFAVFSVYFDMSDQLVLLAPVPIVEPNPDRNYPEGKDRFEVRLAPMVLRQLTARGVKDPQSYFQFKTIHAKGKARTSIYSSFFPAIYVRYLFVDNLADIEVVED